MTMPAIGSICSNCLKPIIKAVPDQCECCGLVLCSDCAEVKDGITYCKKCAEEIETVHNYSVN